MASGPGYPLERLAALRAQRAAGAAIDLAAAMRAAADAEDAAARASAHRETAEAAARAVVLVDGAAPGWEIARRAAYAERLRRDVVRAREVEAERRAEAAAWREEVAAARAQVVETRSERDVVERHRDRWEDEVRKNRERSDD